MMKKQPLVMKSGAAQALSVLGTQVRFLCESESTVKAWSLMEDVLPLDAGPPPHDHDWDEAYYGPKGEVEFTMETETVTVQEGDFVYAPGGTLHGFHGVSADAARMLIFDVPGHFGSFFKAVDRELKMPGAMVKVPEIGLRNGIRFICPSNGLT